MSSVSKILIAIKDGLRSSYHNYDEDRDQYGCVWGHSCSAPKIRPRFGVNTMWCIGDTDLGGCTVGLYCMIADVWCMAGGLAWHQLFDQAKV